MFAWLKRLWEKVRQPFYAAHIDPPVIPCVDRAQAETAARTFAASDPLLIFRPVAATGSMFPLIPKAPCFLVCRLIPFADLRPGVVVTYWPSFAAGQNYVHRLVSKDGLGYLASGDSNPRTESWARVTAGNFEGRVERVWTFPQTTPV